MILITGIACDKEQWCRSVVFFFFNDTATTEIYTLSLHDALPISLQRLQRVVQRRHHASRAGGLLAGARLYGDPAARSEAHTSELQSPCNLVCRLLLDYT